MAKITRPDINVQGFASSPQSQERTTFGTETESTNLADFLTPEFLRGWGVLPVGGKPPYQWFNGAVYLISQLQAMQFQQGIPEYALSQEFHRNGLTAKNGVLYRSKTDNNTGNDPETDLANWDINGAVRQNEIYSIGLTGDYATINEALESFSLRYPVFKKEGVKVTLELEAGFVMQEQVIARGIDLSWIEITGVDAETVVDRASLTVDISSGDNIYPVFGVSDSGKSPRISQLFSMNRSGADVFKKGVYATGAGSSINVSSGCGVKNCYGEGCEADQGAIIYAEGSDSSGAESSAFIASNGANISCPYSNGDNSLQAFRVRGAFLNAISASGKNCYGQAALRVDQGGNAIIDGADISGCTGAYGIFVLQGSKASATLTNYRKGASDDPNDCYVVDGSIVSASDSTGGVNVTENTVTGFGIFMRT